MSTQEPEFTEEELRAIEAEMQRVTVDDVLMRTIVSLLNLGARKGGLAGPSVEGAAPPEPDLHQVRQAVEGARALMPLVEPNHAEELGPVRDALSRLQMFYAQHATAGEPPAGEAPPKDPAAGPAQSSGRLWVPGQ